MQMAKTRSRGERATQTPTTQPFTPTATTSTTSTTQPIFLTPTQNTSPPREIHPLPKYAQFRSNIKAFIRAIKSVKLGKEHESVLRRTPFWNFFESVIYRKFGDTKRCRKTDSVALSVIHTYDPSNSKFIIAGKEMTLSARDISLIFGINQGSEALNLTWAPKKASPFVQRVFGKDKKNVSKTDIDKALIHQTKLCGKSHYEDVARLLCIHAFVTIFFPTTTNLVPASHIRYVEDIDNMGNYAWCDAIREKLMTSIHTKHHNPTAVQGCVISLLYWLCEHTTLLNQDLAVALPRYIKWNLNTLAKILVGKPIATLTAEEVNENELELTEEETTIYGDAALQTQNPVKVPLTTPHETQHMSEIDHELTVIPTGLEAISLEEFGVDKENIHSICCTLISSLPLGDNFPSVSTFVPETNFDTFAQQNQTEDPLVSNDTMFKTAPTQYCGHQEIIDEMKTENTKLLEENENLKHMVEELKTKCDEQIEELNQKNEDFQLCMTTLQVERDELEKKNNNLIQQQQALRQKLGEPQHQIESSVAIEQLQKQRDDAIEQIQQLQETENNFRSKMLKLSKEVAFLKIANKNRVKEVEMLQQSLKDMDEFQKNVELENVKLQEKIFQLEKTNTSLFADVETHKVTQQHQTRSTRGRGRRGAVVAQLQRETARERQKKRSLICLYESDFKKNKKSKQQEAKEEHEAGDKIRKRKSNLGKY